MPLSPYASLRIPDFRRLLVANGTLTVAREAQIVVVGWQVFALTHDPLTLGLIGLAEALPYIGVALYAGHVADRAERRTLGIAGTIGVILSAIALCRRWRRSDCRGRVWPVYLSHAQRDCRVSCGGGRCALADVVRATSSSANAVAWRTYDGGITGAVAGVRPPAGVRRIRGPAAE